MDYCPAVVALLVFSATPAAAQQNATDELDEIVVTSTRLKEDYETTPPVRIARSGQVNAGGAANVGELINALPGFMPRIAPACTVLDSRNAGHGSLDLRGLGLNRNLVLINSRRVAPYNEFGNMNANLMPSIAVKQDEVINGGASAAWGSYVIAGVVNIIFDIEFTGAKQDGITQ